MSDERKYLVYGGYVVSQRDDEVHYVSPIQVAGLYGVDREKCIIVNSDRDLGIERGNFIELCPQKDGNYNLEERLKEGSEE